MAGDKKIHPAGWAADQFGRPYARQPWNQVWTEVSLTAGEKVQVFVGPGHVCKIRWFGTASAAILTLYDDGDNASLANPIIAFNALATVGKDAAATNYYEVDVDVEVTNGLIIDATTNTISQVHVYFYKAALTTDVILGGRDGYMGAMGNKYAPIMGRQYYYQAKHAADTTSVQIETVPVFLSHVIFGQVFDGDGSSNQAVCTVTVYDSASADSGTAIILYTPAYAGWRQEVGLPITKGLRIKCSNAIKPGMVFVYHKYAT